MVSTGIGKSRGTLSGTEENISYSTIMMSSGESPSIDMTNDGGSRGRIISLWSYPFKKQSKEIRNYISKLDDILRNNYGHAARKIASFILNNKKDWQIWKKAYKEICRELSNKENLNGVQGRVSENIAAIATAIPLIHAAMPELQRDINLKAIIDEISELAHKESTLEDNGSRFIQILLDYIMENNNRCLTKIKSSKLGQIAAKDLDIYADYDGSDWNFIGISSELFKYLIKDNQLNKSEVLRTLETKGLLDVNKSSKGSQRQVVITSNSTDSAVGVMPVQVAPVIETVTGTILNAQNAAPAVEPVVQVTTSPAVAPLVAPVVSTPVAGITFGQLSMMYLDQLRVSGRTEKHIANLESLLKHMFFDILGKDAPVAGMTYLKDIVPFIRQMQGVSPQTGKPRSQTTVNRYCDFVDAIFNFGMEMELISKSPMKGRKKAKERPRDVQVSVDDIRRIMDHAEPHICWAMEACFNLGTRPGPSELFALRWEHVDFDAGTVRIYATKTKTFRTVPVTAAFLERLRAMREISKSGYLVEYAGKPVKTIRGGFNKACAKAGITVDVRMYDLRHLFATTMLANGADLAAVSKLMGHSTVKMTADVYYHYLEGEKEKAVGKLPSLVGV